MIKVLIVEDEAGIRSSLANAYSWSEMECELLGCAASGIEALEICLKVQPDIIISDIVMPGIDGLTFLKYIKDKYPEIQFIILTGHRNFDYAKDALNIGASYFMLKPINYEELKENICRLASQIVNSNEERETENKHFNLEGTRPLRQNGKLPYGSHTVRRRSVGWLLSNQRPKHLLQ